MDKAVEQASNDVTRLLSANWICRMVYTAVELGIPAILERAPGSADEIAEKTGCVVDPMNRFLRALAQTGFLEQDHGHGYTLTPLGYCLSDRIMGPIIRMFLGDWHVSAWRRMKYALQTGGSAFNKTHGMSAFEFLASDTEASMAYIMANNVKAMASHRNIVHVYPFPGKGRILDAGGGAGGLLSVILREHPGLSGCVAELPSVVPIARHFIKDMSISDRCEILECDLFKELPQGYDIYLLSNILHDWDDEHCINILNNIKKAMKDNSRMLVIEMLLDADDISPMAHLMDMEVMLMGNGRERTRKEFEHLFIQTRLELKREFKLGGGVYALETSHKSQ